MPWNALKCIASSSCPEVSDLGQSQTSRGADLPPNMRAKNDRTNFVAFARHARDMRVAFVKLSESVRCFAKILRTSRTSWVGRAHMTKLLRHFREQITTRDAGNVRKKFQTFLKFRPNKKRLPRTIDDASEPPRMFGDVLEPNIRMLDFATFFDIRILRESLVCPVKTGLKAGFHWAHERFAMYANVENQHSYFRLQNVAKHARGFGSVVNCSRESFFVRPEFQKSLKFLANVSSIPGRDLLSKMS